MFGRMYKDLSSIGSFPFAASTMLLAAAARKRRAQELLLSDAEYETFVRMKHARTENLRTPCIVCRELGSDSMTWFSGCNKHPVCQSCKAFGATCGVLSCPVCPPQPLHAELLCKTCNATTLTKVFGFNFTCDTCGEKQEGNYLRMFTRNGRLTNFLTVQERDEIFQRPLHTLLSCPCCTTHLERASACNEMYHCGRQVSCAACGSCSFPWEEGLQQHRKESCCPKHIDDDTDAKRLGEDAARRIRFLKLLQNAKTI